MAAVILVLALVLVLLPAQAGEIDFVTDQLPWAVVDKGYAPPPLEVRVSGKCTSGGIGYAVVSGALPEGIQLSKLGYFSGNPLHKGSSEFIVRASNGCAWTGRRFSIVVAAAPVLTVTPAQAVFQWTASPEQRLEQTLHVSSTWPKLSYQVIVTGADWLKVIPENGFTTPENGDTIHIRLTDAASHLKPGRYTGMITVSAWRALNPPAVAVELTVSGN